MWMVGDWDEGGWRRGVSKERPHIGGIVTIAAIAGMVAAVWTVITYTPPKDVLEAQLERLGRQERARAQADRVGGFERAEARIRDLWSRGQTGEALEIARSWSKGNREDVVAGYWRVALLTSVGDLDSARLAAERRIDRAVAETDARPNDAEAWYHRGWFERALGRELDASASFDTAAELLAARRPSRMGDHVWQYNIACYESLRGNVASGLEALDRATELGWNDGAWMRVDPDLASVRMDARFNEIAARMDRGPD